MLTASDEQLETIKGLASMCSLRGVITRKEAPIRHEDSQHFLKREALFFHSSFQVKSRTRFFLPLPPPILPPFRSDIVQTQKVYAGTQLAPVLAPLRWPVMTPALC